MSSHTSAKISKTFKYISYDIHVRNKFLTNMPPKTERKELESSTKERIIGMNFSG